MGILFLIKSENHPYTLWEFNLENVGTSIIFDLSLNGHSPKNKITVFSTSITKNMSLDTNDSLTQYAFSTTKQGKIKSLTCEFRRDVRLKSSDDMSNSSLTMCH